MTTPNHKEDAMDVDSPLLAPTKRQLVNRLAELLPLNVVDAVRALIIIGPAVDGTTVYPEELVAAMLMTRPTGLQSATRVAITRLHQRLGVGLPSGAWEDIAAGRMPAPKQVPSRYDCQGLPLHVVDGILAASIAINVGANSQTIPRSIHKHLCVSPAQGIPEARIKGTLAHPKHGRFLNMVASGKLAVIRHVKPTEHELSKAMDVASANGQLGSLRWLLQRAVDDYQHAHHFAAGEGSAVPDVERKLDLAFTKDSLLGAIRHGHLNVLDFWLELTSNKGVRVGTELLPVRVTWPDAAYLEAVKAGSMRSVLWLLEKCPVRSAKWIKKGVVEAVMVGHVTILQHFIRWLQGASPSKFLTQVMDAQVVNLALSNGQLASLRVLAESGVLSSVTSNPKMRKHVCADLDHLSSYGRIHAMEWCAINAARYSIRLRHSCVGINDASATFRIRELRWWSQKWANGQFMVKLSPDSARSFCTVARLRHDEIVDWWFEQANAGYFDFRQAIDDCVAEACEAGQIQTLSWLLTKMQKARIPFDCSHPAMDAALVAGNVPVLDWFLDHLRSGEILALRYSAHALTRASIDGHIDILRWFESRRVPFLANPYLEAFVAKSAVTSFHSDVKRFWLDHQVALDATIGWAVSFELSNPQWLEAQEHYQRELAAAVHQQAAEANASWWAWVTAKFTGPMESIPKFTPLFTASKLQLQPVPTPIGNGAFKQSIRGIMSGTPPQAPRIKLAPASKRSGRD